MKKIICLLCSLVLLCSLCGCGIAAPYLKDSVRSEIEKQLISGLEIAPCDTEGNMVSVTVKGSKDYDIHNLRLCSDNSSLIAFRLSQLPAGEEYRGTDYISDLVFDQECYYFTYTIGDYSYRSANFSIASSPTDAGGIMELMVDTTEGVVFLDYVKGTEFETGKEIEGLKNMEIYSLKPALYPLSNGHIDMTLHYTCSTMDSPYTHISVKLIDQDGMVVGTDSIYSDKDSGSLWFFNSDISKGRYTLRFEELD